MRMDGQCILQHVMCPSEMEMDNSIRIDWEVT